MLIYYVVTTIVDIYLISFTCLISKMISNKQTKEEKKEPEKRSTHFLQLMYFCFLFGVCMNKYLYLFLSFCPFCLHWLLWLAVYTGLCCCGFFFPSFCYSICFFSIFPILFFFYLYYLNDWFNLFDFTLFSLILFRHRGTWYMRWVLVVMIMVMNYICKICHIWYGYSHADFITEVLTLGKTHRETPNFRNYNFCRPFIANQLHAILPRLIYKH